MSIFKLVQAPTFWTTAEIPVVGQDYAERRAVNELVDMVGTVQLNERDVSIVQARTVACEAQYVVTNIFGLLARGVKLGEIERQFQTRGAVRAVCNLDDDILVAHGLTSTVAGGL